MRSGEGYHISSRIAHFPENEVIERMVTMSRFPVSNMHCNRQYMRFIFYHDIKLRSGRLERMGTAVMPVNSTKASIRIVSREEVGVVLG